MRIPSLRKPPPPTEHQEQCIVADYLRARGIRFFAVPNGGHRHPAVAAKLKAEGCDPGVPDLFVTTRPPGLYGVPYIVVEMKRTKGGRLSVEQRDWLEHLKAQGAVTMVAHGADEAIAFLETYFPKGWRPS